MSLLTRALTAGLLTLSLAGPSQAGLPSINPRMPKDVNLGLRPYAATTKITLPKSFLSKTYLYGGMVEAATDNCLTLGMGSTPVKVRFKVEGESLLMLEDQRDRIADIGASPENVLNRYPIVEKGESVEVDFAHPEIVNVSIVVGNTGHDTKHPGYIYDVVNEPGYLAYGEKFLVATGGANDMPAQVTLAIKFFLKELQPTGYKPREYTDEDFMKYGYFVTAPTVRNEDGTTQEKVFADRRDLSKKIVYTLHPSIPEKFRPAFREAILTWNQVFKKTHGIEPVEVRDGKNDEIPGDIRHSVIYWVDYPTPFGGGAIGPHTSNPDTGEILDADVIFYAGAFRDEIAGLRKEADGKKATEGESGFVNAIRDLFKNGLPRPLRVNRGFNLRIGNQTALSFQPACEFPVEEDVTIAARAMVDVTTLSDDQAMERIIREVIPHEIGHTLGLRHNFASSSDLANLGGAEATTVMEYQVSLQSLLAPGPYDYAAIAYGYEGDKSHYEGKSFRFATDGSQAVDPLSNQFDSGDPLAFYTGQYKHFLKLRDIGFFSSLRAYARGQRKSLECIRKFVNRDEQQSDKAFAFLLGVLMEKGEKPPFNAIERLQAMQVLTNDVPAIVGGGSPRAAFESLSDEQLAMLSQALVKNVVPDGKDIFEVRLSMVESLKAMNNIYGFKALEAIAAAYKKAFEGPQAQQLPPREQELGLRIQQSVSNYFNK